MGESVNEGASLKAVQWVAREVLVHEAALRSWLRKVADANDIEDIVQESYYRISSLRDVSHIRNGRAYLFTTAKMIVLGHLRRSRIVSIEAVAEIENLQVASNTSSPEEMAVYRNQLQFIQGLIDKLPERCRQVFRMRKFEGISQRDVARQLDIPEHTVENDVAKALRLIQQAIAQGENEAETSLERTTRHGRARISTGSQ